MPLSPRPHERCWSSSSASSRLSSLPAPCIPAGIASAEADYAAALASIPNGPAKTQGIALGEAAADAILTARADDGAVGPFLNFPALRTPILASTSARRVRPFIAFEGWENVTPFVLHHSSQFRPGPPYKVDSKKYAADFDEVKSLGGDGRHDAQCPNG